MLGSVPLIFIYFYIKTDAEENGENYENLGEDEEGQVEEYDEEEEEEEEEDDDEDEDEDQEAECEY